MIEHALLVSYIPITFLEAVIQASKSGEFGDLVLQTLFWLETQAPESVSSFLSVQLSWPAFKHNF